MKRKKTKDQRLKEKWGISLIQSYKGRFSGYPIASHNSKKVDSFWETLNINPNCGIRIFGNLLYKLLPKHISDGNN